MRSDAKEKAARVRMLVMDVDGVMTDGRALYGPGGFQALFFNIKDGAGIKYAKRAGLKTAIISGREVEAVMARAEELGVDYVKRGAKVKLVAYEELMTEAGLADEAVAYIGDDLPDLPVMRRAGLAMAPADAVAEVLAAADVVTEAAGGAGAVREAVELILRAQGQWDLIMERYRET